MAEACSHRAAADEDFPRFIGFVRLPLIEHVRKEARFCLVERSSHSILNCCFVLMFHTPRRIRFSQLLLGVAAAVFFWLRGSIRAEDLITTIEVSGAHGKETVRSTTKVPKTRPESRSVIEGKTNEEFTLHWTMRNAGKTLIEDVLVHFFVAEEDQLGQRAVPNLRPEKVVLEGALTMDFNSTNSATGTLSFRIQKPGAYLVRVEAQNLPDAVIEPPVAALDLRIR